MIIFSNISLPRQKFASKEGVVPAQQPPDDSLETTIEELRRKQEAIRKEADRQIARLERMIQVALEDDSASTQVPAASTAEFPPVRPDQFKEVGKFHAMVAYLRDRPGQIPISKIREDLKAEGVILCGRSGRVRRELRARKVISSSQQDHITPFSGAIKRKERSG